MANLYKTKNVPIRFLIVLVQSAHGILLDHLQVDFVAHKISDVIYTIFNHSRPARKNTLQISVFNKKNNLGLHYFWYYQDFDATLAVCTLKCNELINKRATVC